MTRKERMSADDITFGIELETGIPSVNMDFQIGGYHRGINLLSAPQFHGKYWKAEHDGSLVFSLSHGCEFVSPVLQGTEGVQNVIDMVEWINRHDARVNKTCGLHIHIGWKSVIGADASMEQVAAYLSKLGAITNINRNAIFSQTGKRRDQNQYCKVLPESFRTLLSTVEQSGMTSLIDRYCMLNVKPVFTKGTFEFRAFAGTLNINLILHHLWTALFIARFAQKLKTVPWEGRGWMSETGGIGTQALKGFYHKIKHHCLVGEMNRRYRDMKKAALDNAKKFDRSVRREEVA